MQIRSTAVRSLLAVLVMVVVAPRPASAAISAPVDSPVVITNLGWVHWTSATIGAAGSALGSVVITNLLSVDVLYEGAVAPETQFDSDISFWSPGTTYLSLTISNLPPFNDIVAVPDQTGVPGRVTFSEPVEDPVFLFAGLGSVSLPTSLHFNAPFSILSQGPGYWGPGELLIDDDEQTLIGLEGHGAIQFSGSFSTIEWLIGGTVNDFHGFTVGIPVEPNASPIPELSPARAIALTVLLVLGTHGLRRRRHAQLDPSDRVRPGQN